MKNGTNVVQLAKKHAKEKLKSVWLYVFQNVNVPKALFAIVPVNASLLLHVLELN